MYVLEVRRYGKSEYFGPFPNEDRARRYADAGGWDPSMTDILPLIVPNCVAVKLNY